MNITKTTSGGWIIEHDSLKVLLSKEQGKALRRAERSGLTKTRLDQLQKRSLVHTIGATSQREEWGSKRGPVFHIVALTDLGSKIVDAMNKTFQNSTRPQDEER